MSIVFRMAERYVSRRFFQSVLLILGVALGVAMVIAIDVANGSARRAFGLSTESVTGSATHQIIGGPGGLPTELYTQIRVELGIRGSAPVVESFVRTVELDDRAMRLLGVDIFAESPFRGYLDTVEIDNDNTSDSGFNALESFVAQPGSVLIASNVAEQFGVTTGDTLTLRAGTRAVPVTINGLLQPGDAVSEQALSDLMLADIATAQEITGQPGVIDRIDLILTEEEAPAVLSQIRELLPPGARAGSVSAGDDTLAQMTEAFELNLQALSLLALVVGVFLIYNTVTFSVVQRRHMLGVLRSLGMTGRQIFTMIVGETLILGVVGTILGLGLGVIFGRLAVDLVAQTISDLYFVVNVQSISVDTFTLVKGAGIGVLASAGAAAIPALAAMRTPPAGTMRRSDQEQTALKLVPWVTLGAMLLVIVGLVLLNLPTDSVEISFGGLFAIVVGGALFTPLVLLLAMRAAAPLTGRLFGVVGRMAPRAVARSLSRTSVAVAALTIAVSVIVGVSVMIASFRSTVDDWLGTTLGSDIYVSPPLLTANQASVDVAPSIRDVILAVDGVESVSAARSVSVVAPDYPDMPPANVQAIDSDIAVERQFKWNDSPGGDYWAALENGAVMVSEPFAFRRGIDQQNNTVTLLTDQGEQTFTVVAEFYDYATDQGRIYMAADVYRQFYDDPFVSSVGIYIASDADIETVMADLRLALVDYDLDVQANRELRAGVFEVFDNAFAITVALRLLATVVAFIGILSALLALQLENTRQYGLMRATGMTPRQLWNFTLIQTGLMGVVAGLLAIPIGLALALVLLFVINVRSFGWTMDFYWVPREFIEAFMVAVVAAVLAGLYPALRLMRLVPSRALRNE